MDLTDVILPEHYEKWIVLDATRKKVLSCSWDPAEALDLAERDHSAEARKDSLLMWVPDPSQIYIF